MYSIAHQGLGIGAHRFEFDVDAALFQGYPEGEVGEGRLKVSVDLRKHTTMLELDLAIHGQVQVACDRCLDPMMLPVEFQGQLLVKCHQAQTGALDDEVWIVSENEAAIDLTHYIYESICLSIPLRRYHGLQGTRAKDCSPRMIRYLGEAQESPSDSPAPGFDPRWAKLKGLQLGKGE